MEIKNLDKEPLKKTKDFSNLSNEDFIKRLPRDEFVSSGLSDTYSRKYLSDISDRENTFKSIEKANLVSSLDERTKASNQGFFDKLGNMSMQILGVVGGGTLEAAGAIPEILKAAVGSSTDFQNVVTDWGKSIQKGAREEFPIYRENPEKAFDFSDPVSYIASNVPSLASSLTFLIPTKGASMVTSKLLKMVVGAERIANMSKNAKFLTQTTGEALLMRNLENFQISGEVYNNTRDSLLTLEDNEYNKFINNLDEDLKKDLQGKTKEEVADYVGKAAGWKAYKYNLPNFAFDFIQLYGLNKAMKGVTSPRLYTKPMSVIKEHYTSLGKTLTRGEANIIRAKKFGLLASTQGTEGIEEMINAIGEGEGMRFGKHIIQNSSKENYEGVDLGRYLKDPHVWEQGLWGFLGGLTTAGVTDGTKSLLNKFKKEGSDPSEEQISEIKSRALTTGLIVKYKSNLDRDINPYTGETITGTEEEKQETKKEILDDILKQGAVSLTLRAAEQGNVSMLQNWLSDSNVQKMVVETSKGTLKDEEVASYFKEISKQVEEYEAIYNQFYNNIRFTKLGNYSTQIKNIILSEAINSQIAANKAGKYSQIYDKKASDLIKDSVFINTLSEEDKTKTLEAIDAFSRYIAIKEFENFTFDNLYSQSYKNKGVKDLIDSERNKQIAKLLEGIDDRFKKDGELNREYIEKKIESLLDKGVNKDIISFKAGKILADLQKSVYNHQTNEHINSKKQAAKTAQEVKTTANNIYNDTVTKTKAAINQVHENIPNFENVLLQMEKDFYAKNSSLPTNEVDFPFRTRIEVLKKKASIKENKESVVEPIVETVEPINTETSDFIKTLDAKSREDLEDLLNDIRQSDEETLNNIINRDTSELNEFDTNVHNEVLKVAKETLSDNKYDEITISNEDKISDTGGDTSFNIFLANSINANYTRESSGDSRVLNNANAIHATLNHLKEGDKVEIGYATKDDFPNTDEWVKHNQEKTEDAISVRVRFLSGEIESIGFINSTNYLEKELNLVTALNDYSNEADLRQIYENLHLVLNREEQDAWNTLKKNELLKQVINLDSSKEEIDSELKHLYNIIYFGNQKITNFDYNKLKQSLHNWYLKINRDLTNSNKIKEQLKSTDKIITTVAYSSSGTILRSVDDKGNVKLRSLNETLGGNEEDYNIPIFVTSKFDKTVLKGSNGQVHTSDKEYREKAFVLIKTKGESIPQELIVNSLKSKKDGVVDTKTTEVVTEKIKELLGILKSGSGINSPLFLSKRDELGEIVIVNKDTNDIKTFLKFYDNGTYGPNAKLSDKGMIINLYLDSNGELIAYANNTRVDSRDLGEIIGTLNRSFSYDRISKNESYTSPTTGINYTSYVDFLIKEDILLTDVGKMVTKDGVKISNMAVKDDTNRNSRPLIININSNVETKSTETKSNTTELETVDTLLEDFSKTKYGSLYNKAKKLKINFHPTLLKIGETIPNSDKTVNENTRGAYSPSDNTIYLTENVPRTNNERRTGTIAHEILHGVLKNKKLTEEQVARIKEFNKDLLKEVAKGEISEEAKEFLKPIINSKGELKDSEVTQILKLLENESNYEEVITYAFENVKFAKFLLSIESKDTDLRTKLKYKHRTFWGRLSKIIRDIVDTIFTGTSKLDELNYILNDIFRKTDGVKKTSRKEEKEARRNQIYQRTNEDSRQEVEDILRQIAETEQELEYYLENKDYDVEYKILQGIPIINKASAEKETGAKVGIGKDIHLSKASPNSNISVDAAAHSIWEDLTEIEKESYDTQDIRNIILDYLTSTETKTSKEKELRDDIKNLEEKLNNVDNSEPEIDFQNIDINDTQVNYTLKSVDILQSSKADEIFRKGDKNNWDIDKILLELNIPKEQKELIKSFNTRNREEILTNLIANYSYTVEINIAKEGTDFYGAEDFRIGNTRYYTVTGERFYKIENDFANNFNKESVEIDFKEFEKAAKQYKDINEKPTQHYSNLTVPGGTNYTENEIATPLITPSIKGHAQFATDNGIGWFRSDDRTHGGQSSLSYSDKVEANGEWDRQDEGFNLGSDKYTQTTISEVGVPPEFWDTSYKNGVKISNDEYYEAKRKANISVYKNEKTRRILEVQSDLFQKGRDKEDLIGGTKDSKDEFNDDYHSYTLDGVRYTADVYAGRYQKFEEGYSGQLITKEEFERNIPNKKTTKSNQFLQLLNKDNNWVTFFVKSIIQDSAKKGYEKVLFPSGDTASKVEGHTTLEEFKKQKEDRIKELERYLSGKMPMHEEGIYSQIPKIQLNNEINQLKQELERVEKEGFGALKPIYNFYENTVTNILNKQGFNPTTITDEYDNTWSEIELEPIKSKLSNILFQDISLEDNAAHIENIGSAMLFKYAQAYVNVNKKISIEDIKNRIINKIQDDLNTKSFTPEQVELNTKFIENLKLPQSNIWDNILDTTKRKYGIGIETDYNITSIDEDLIKKTWEGDTSITPGKDTVSTFTKAYINSVQKRINYTEIERENIDNGILPVKYENTPTGYAETLDFDLIIGKIFEKLQSVQTTNQLLDKIFEISITEPAFTQIYNDINKDENLRNILFRDLVRRVADRTSISIKTEDNNIESITAYHENEKAYYPIRLADIYKNGIEDKLKSGYYDNGINSQILVAINGKKVDGVLVDGLKQLNSTTDIELAAKQLSKVYSLLGISVESDKLQRYLFNNKQNLKDEIDSFIENILAIKKEIYKAAEKGNHLLEEINSITKEIAVLLESEEDEITLQPKRLAKYKELRLAKIKTRDIRFDGYGYVRDGLTKKLDKVDLELNEQTITNVAGNQTYLTDYHSYLSQWFSNKENKDEFRDLLLKYKEVPKMKHSFLLNQLLNEDGTLNEKNVNNFTLDDYGGSKDINTQLGKEYKDFNANDFLLAGLLLHIDSRHSDRNVVSHFITIPSDASNTKLISFKKIPFNKEDMALLNEAIINLNNPEYDKTKLYKTDWYENIWNTVLQEVEEAETAFKLIFDVIGSDIVEKNHGLNLIENYHQKGGRVLDDEGNPTGNVFKFSNFISKGKTLSDLINKDKNHLAKGYYLKEDILNENGYTELGSYLRERTLLFIGEMVVNSAKAYSEYQNLFSKKTNIEAFDTSVAEFVINDYLFNVEFRNLFGSGIKSVKNFTEVTKRGKGTVSNGSGFAVSNVEEGYHSVTLLDVTKEDTDGISAITKQTRLKRNTRRGNFKIDNIVDALEEGNFIPDNKEDLVQEKPFYYGFDYDSSLGMFVEKQVKNSIITLDKDTYKGLDLGELAALVEELETELNTEIQLDFKSAVKTGVRKVIKIHDSEGNLLPKDVVKDLIKNNIEFNYYKNLRIVQDTKVTIKNTVNKLGSQITKVILTNLKDGVKYNVNGKSLSKDQITNEVFDIFTTNVFESENRLLESLISSNVITEEDIVKVLNDEANSRNWDDNLKEALEIKDEKSLVPLYYNLVQKRYISFLTSLWTNSVTNQKMNGYHAYQVPNLFMSKKELEKEQSQAKLNPKEIDWLKGHKGKKLEFFNKKNNTLVAEVLVSRWDSRFKGKNINDLIESDPKILQSLGYRIPTEGKYSAIVFKVVGFLPDTYEGSIVVPDGWTAISGSDFDIDSIFVMSYNLTFKDKKLVTIPYLDETNSTIEERYYRYIRSKKVKEFIDLQSIDKLTFDLDNLQAGIDSLNESLTENITDKQRKTYLSFLDTLLDEYEKLDLEKEQKEKEKLVVTEEFKALSIAEQNSKSARDNRLIDLFIGILNNPNTVEEILETSNFKDVQQPLKYLQSLNTYHPNLWLDKVQLTRIIMGNKDLKGISVNLKTLTDIANVSKIYNPISPIKRKLSQKEVKNIGKEKLIEFYGEDYDVKNRIITFKYLGNNSKGTNDNILRNNITSFVSQVVANVLDAVANPMSSNTNPFTVTQLMMFPMFGDFDYRYSTYLIEQPIIKEWASLDNRNSIWLSNDKNPYYELKNKYTRKIKDVEGEVSGEEIANKEMKLFTARELLSNITPKDTTQYYKDQLDVLEYFATLKQVEQDLDTLRVLASPDVIGAGPTFNTTRNITETINDSVLDYMIGDKNVIDALYPKDIKTSNQSLTSLKEELDLLNNLELINIGDKSVLEFEDNGNKVPIEIINIVKLNKENSFKVEVKNLKSGKVYNYIVDSSGFGDKANILLKDNQRFEIDLNYKKEVEQAIKSNLDKAAYPIIQAKYNSSNKSSYEHLAGFFIEEVSDEIKLILSNFKFKRERVTNRVMKEINRFLITSSEYYMNIDKTRLLGLKDFINFNTELDITKSGNIVEFNKLSAANKLYLVQEQLRPIATLSRSKNLLANIQVDPSYNKNYKAIQYKDLRDKNVFKKDFENLLIDENPYVKNLAEDLVKYALVVDGLDYGNNLMSIIPIKYQASIGLGDHSRQKFDEAVNKKSILPNETEFLKIFYGKNWKDTSLVPIVRSVPYDNTYPVWSESESGVIFVSDKQFRKMHKDNKRAQVVRVKRSGVNKLYFKEQLEKGYRYTAINMLERWEFGTVSDIQENNTANIVNLAPIHFQDIQLQELEANNEEFDKQTKRLAENLLKDIQVAIYQLDTFNAKKFIKQIEDKPVNEYSDYELEETFKRLQILDTAIHEDLGMKFLPFKNRNRADREKIVSSLVDIYNSSWKNTPEAIESTFRVPHKLIEDYKQQELLELLIRQANFYADRIVYCEENIMSKYKTLDDDIATDLDKSFAFNKDMQYVSIILDMYTEFDKFKIQKTDEEISTLSPTQIKINKTVLQSKVIKDYVTNLRLELVDNLTKFYAKTVRDNTTNKELINKTEAELYEYIKDKITQMTDSTGTQLLFDSAATTTNFLSGNIIKKANASFNTARQEKYEAKKLFNKYVQDLKSAGYNVSQALGTDKYGELNGKFITGYKYRKAPKEVRDFVDNVQTLLKKYLELAGNKDTIIHQDFIPAVANLERSKADKFKDFMAYFPEIDNHSRVIVDKKGNKIKNPTLRHSSFVVKKLIIPVIDKPEGESIENFEIRILNEIYEAYDMSFNSLKEVREYNEHSKTFNRQLASDEHVKNISYDLNKVIPLFLDNVIDYSYKVRLQDEFSLFTNYLKDEVKFVKNKSIINKVTLDITKKRELVTDSGSESNELKRVQYWFENNILDEGNRSGAEATKWARVLQNYTAIKNLGLNPFAGVNNLAYGTITNLIYTMSNGNEFSKKDRNAALASYWKNMMSYVLDTDEFSNRASSKESAMFKYFDIVNTQTEEVEKRREINEGESYYSKFKNKGGFFFMQSAGEHMIQNVLLLSFLKGNKVKDGKIVSKKEYIESKYKVLTGKETKTEAEEIAKHNTNVIKEVKKEFAELPSVEDYFVYEDGYITLKEGIDSSSLSKFRDKVKRKSDELHGVYNKEDKSVAQAVWYWRAALQHRKWLRPGWNRRFGSRFFKDSGYIEASEVRDKGTYTSLWQYMWYGVYQNLNDEERQAGLTELSFKKMGLDMLNHMAMLRTHYRGLDYEERQRVKSAGIEIMTLSIISLMLAAALKYKDDDEEETSRGLGFTINILDRLKGELSFYTPGGVVNASRKILRSPAASEGSITDMFSFANSVLLWGVGSERAYFQSGVYHDELKAKIHGVKLIPFANQAYKWYYIDRNNRILRLY